MYIIFVSASSLNIGEVFGCLIGGYCGGRFGPKRTILCSGFPAIIGWLCLAFSPNLGVLIFARVVCGVATNIASANCSMLVAQYSCTDRRGAFLSLFALMVELVSWSHILLGLYYTGDM